MKKAQCTDAWLEKPLHGQHLTYLLDHNVNKHMSNLWLKIGHLEVETEYITEYILFLEYIHSLWSTGDTKLWPWVQMCIWSTRQNYVVKNLPIWITTAPDYV